MADEGSTQVEEELLLVTANACEDYIAECGLPPTFSIDEVDYQLSSHTHASTIPEDDRNQLFDIFEVNMRDFYERIWGWDKKMKWYVRKLQRVVGHL